MANKTAKKKKKKKTQTVMIIYFVSCKFFKDVNADTIKQSL